MQLTPRRSTDSLIGLDGDTHSDNEDDRTIYINQPQDPNSQFPSNRVSTTKYSWWNFVFKNLWEQFQRIANFYFLLVCIIELIPGLSPLSPVASITPLVFVLGVTMVKDLYEDIKRSRADKEVNMSLAKVLRNKQWVEVYWQDLVVGDIVHLDNNNDIPADLAPLSSSNPGGTIHMETSNLDGETGHKLRHSIPLTSLDQSIEDLSNLRGHVTAPYPNIDLDSFDAKFVDARGQVVPLSEQNLLLRGAMIQNTEWVNGLVVFTGKDTKLVLNQQEAPSKLTHVERQLNRYILGILLVELLLCIVSGLISLFWETHYGIYYPYLHISPETKNSIGYALQVYIERVGSFFILYSNFIPISLYVSMEMVKLISSTLMSWDVELVDSETQCGLTVKTSNLLEELGQVNHIFSDKTGTLTENKMKFRKCSINGKRFNVSEVINQNDPLSALDPGEIALTNEIATSDRSVYNFLLSIVLNHSIEVREKDDVNASSPDEESLVGGVSRFGFKLEGRSNTNIEISVGGKLLKFELLNLIEFTSTRKRMSVILRDPEGKIMLLCKGADEVIFDRLGSDYDKELFDETRQHVNFYAEKGLRTLCYAQVELDSKYYSEWAEIYKKAQASTVGRRLEVERAAEKIEKNLVLLGATAIEDRLQDFVPETLSDLMRANIKLWILTGDKQETAISIGRSCNVLTDAMKVLKINARSSKDANDILASHNELADYYAAKPIGLVIDGKSLSFCLEIPGNPFLKLALRCSTVICCRVSPMQKAQVVRMVKKDDRDNVTLSIGDGANDVSMIQEADVGIGIRGREGSQASRSSDFSISKFYMLKRLLLVHGRFTYVRIATLIQYSFYKNIAFTVIQFFYSFYNGFSGQTLFDSWVITVFNLVFTSWPIVIYSVFEEDISEKYLMRFPELYNRSKDGHDFNLQTFALWFINALWHGLVFFFGPLMLWGPGVLGPSGTTYGLWTLGAISATACVITVTLKLSVETYYWTWFMVFFVVGSVSVYFLFLYVYGFITFLQETNFLYLFVNFAHAPQFWFSVFVVVAFAILPDFAFRWLQQHIYPADWQILKEKRVVDGEEKTLALSTKSIVHPNPRNHQF